jgi:hypothetical protein
MWQRIVGCLSRSSGCCESVKAERFVIWREVLGINRTESGFYLTFFDRLENEVGSGLLNFALI